MGKAKMRESPMKNSVAIATALMVLLLVSVAYAEGDFQLLVKDLAGTGTHLIATFPDMASCISAKEQYVARYGALLDAHKQIAVCAGANGKNVQVPKPAPAPAPTPATQTPETWYYVVTGKADVMVGRPYSFTTLNLGVIGVRAFSSQGECLSFSSDGRGMEFASDMRGLATTQLNAQLENQYGNSSSWSASVSSREKCSRTPY